MAVNKIAGIVMLLIFLVSGAAAQEHLPFTPDAGRSNDAVHEPWLAPAVGYVSSRNALRVSLLSGNLWFNRAGGYVTIEKGLDSNYFTNIYGVTVTVSRHIYLWGGMDLFTSRGVFHSFRSARKETGIGFMPWKDLTATAGWSKSVGFSFSLGWKLPLFNGGGGAGGN